MWTDDISKLSLNSKTRITNIQEKLSIYILNPGQTKYPKISNLLTHFFKYQRIAQIRLLRNTIKYKMEIIKTKINQHKVLNY
jgi:hypothetical protein